ncbi:hypothetical protein CCACVL1_28927 [Corchorus capsularis]|uniref:Uncharacterized protein n=1 Tax=Corchorus capsularis TaxID=210143 RepID=A0A1R3G4T2_COCAP|nr:hypothetical protein CCACVL1_28927 [Corchorus capsularis]
MTLEESTEIDLCPPFRGIIKLILKIVEEYTEYGSAGASLFKRWLGLTGLIHHNATDLVAMLNDAQILKLLYRRGIADLYPPRLSLHQAFDGLVIISPTTTLTDVPIYGEEKKIYLIATPPLSKAWVSVSSTINSTDSSTNYDLQLLLDTTGVRFPNIISRDYDQFCLYQEPCSIIRLIKILIFNAAGVCNPAFTYMFAVTCVEQNPDFVLVTETRLGENEGRDDTYFA